MPPAISDADHIQFIIKMGKYNHGIEFSRNEKCMPYPGMMEKTYKRRKCALLIYKLIGGPALAIIMSTPKPIIFETPATALKI